MVAKTSPGLGIDRLSATDLMQLASDRPTAPAHMGAVLVFPTALAGDLPAVRDLLAGRLRQIPRFRQRLVDTPPGCGRPIWVDDPFFDIARHVTALPCPAPGDDRALLDVAARLTTRRLRRDRPLWSMTYVTGLTHGRTALVAVVHHVLADGIGGLAVLASLADGSRVLPGPEPAPMPSLRELVVDATLSRLRALTMLPEYVRRIRAGVAELGSGRVARAPRTSLNRPTGPRRRLAVVRTDLAAVHDGARSHGGTVNDALVTAAAGASAALLAPVFRFVAAIRLMGWFVDHQRLVNTFVTDLRGPATRISLGGVPVVDILPVTQTMGNVPVAFAALSYAGRLVVTVTGDPTRCPELDVLATDLRHQLDAIAAAHRARSAQGIVSSASRRS